MLKAWNDFQCKMKPLLSDAVGAQRHSSDPEVSLIEVLLVLCVLI